jgi:hypothetical protein
MNTLPRAVIAPFFPFPDSYNALQQHWSSLINSERKHTLSSAHHLLYLALCGKDWRKAYTCVSNPRKLANGAFTGWNLFKAFRMLQSKACETELLAPFDGLVTPTMLQMLRSFLPCIGNPYAFHAEQFANGVFPFDAYIYPETTTLEN